MNHHEYHLVSGLQPHKQTRKKSKYESPFFRYLFSLFGLISSLTCVNPFSCSLHVTVEINDQTGNYLYILCGGNEHHLLMNLPLHDFMGEKREQMKLYEVVLGLRWETKTNPWWRVRRHDRGATEKESVGSSGLRIIKKGGLN